jgi:hypothetical protein
MSTPFFSAVELGSAWKGSGFFTCSALGGAGGQDGLRRIERPSFASRSADVGRLSQPAMRAHSTPRTLPGAPFRRDDGTGEAVGLGTLYCAIASAVGAAAATADHRKSVPSTHMRCMTTASRRARATLAAFTLPLFAIRMAQDLNDDQRP